MLRPDLSFLQVVSAALVFLWVQKLIWRRFDARDIVVAVLLPTYVGYIILTGQGVASTTGLWIYLALTVTFYAAGSLRLPRLWRAGGQDDKDSTRSLKLLTYFVCGGVIYHFVTAGIPLLKRNIDYSRFDLTASGLFGIPGRIYLFGVPLLVFAAVAHFRLHGSGVWWKDPSVRTSLILLLVSRTLGGFKGGMQEAVLIVLVARIATGPPLRLREATKAALPLVVVAAAFAFAVGSLYTSYKGKSLTDSLIDRLTTVAAEPAAIALDGKEARHLASPLKNDILYYGRRYARIGPGVPYPYERLVSATILRSPPDAAFFLPPVTVGGQAESFKLFGLGGALAFMALLGRWANLLRTSTGDRVTTMIGVSYLIWGVILVMVKGGLVYHVMNMGAVLAIGASIWLLGGALSTRSQGLALERLDSQYLGRTVGV